VVAAVMLLALLMAGCGGRESKRAQVAQYLGYLNQLETALSKPLVDISNAGQQFAGQQKVGVGHPENPGGIAGFAPSSPFPGLRPPAAGAPLTPAETIDRAVAQIRALRDQAAAIKAPPAAAHLRALVLELIDGQVRLASEVATLSTFLPRFAQDLQPLGPAMARLTSVLSQQSAYGSAAVAAVYSAKAAALRQFNAVLDGIASSLRGLSPPAVSKPLWSNELTALTGMSVAAGRLAGALQSGPGSNVTQYLQEFNRAAASNHTVTAQEAQIAAVKAYDSDLGGLADLARAITRERLRLSSTLK
jgi:hypothetical protein